MTIAIPMYVESTTVLSDTCTVCMYIHMYIHVHVHVHVHETFFYIPFSEVKNFASDLLSTWMTIFKEGQAGTLHTCIIYTLIYNSYIFSPQLPYVHVHVLCCFALFVCFLACFFLSSFSSLIKTCMMFL